MVTIFDVLSRLGGVFSALTTGGFFFTSIFNYKLMMSSLIGKLFHFKGAYPNKVKKDKQKVIDQDRIFIPKHADFQNCKDHDHDHDHGQSKHCHQSDGK